MACRTPTAPSSRKTSCDSVIERGVRLDVFHVEDAFLAAKSIGAMGVRLPEWWTPDGPRSAEEIQKHYVAYALKLVG